MVERTRIVFDSGGVDCVAYLYMPEATGGGPVPCVVLGHGASGTSANLIHVAERFATAGMAALTFDYRHYGESGGVPRQLMDTERQREDWRARARASTRSESRCGARPSVVAT